MNIKKFVFLFLIIILLSSCGAENKTNLQIEELLLPEDKVPINWSTVYRNTDMIESAYQTNEANLGLYRSFGGFVGRFSQVVLSYNTENSSDGMYDFYSKKIEGSHVDLLPISNDVKSISLNADSWIFGCYKYTDKSTVCAYIAKYSEYVMDVRVDMSFEENIFMTENQFIEIIKEIDRNAVDTINLESEID